MIRIDYHNRRFVPAENTENDKADKGTVFHYRKRDYLGDPRGDVHEAGESTTGRCKSTREASDMELLLARNWAPGPISDRTDKAMT